jgi:transaldolase
MIAAAEAHERGLQRLSSLGKSAPHSTSAFVLGRLQDYLAVVNEEREIGLSTYDLECAVLAAAKRCCTIFAERGYAQAIMPAAFRCAWQVTELAGSPTVMTIHPTVQNLIKEAEERGEVKRVERIDQEVDREAVDRVVNELPEFRMAYEPDGIAQEDFDAFGATSMTLNGFNETGWQKLITYELPK